MKTTLDEVLGEKEIVLLDGSIKEDNNFYWYLGGIKKSNQLDLERVQLEIESLTRFGEVLLRENVRTIPQITQELSCLKDIINNSQAYLFSGTRKEYGSKKDKLEQLHNLAFDIYKYSKGKEIGKAEAGVLNGNLEVLFKVINNMSQSFELKRDSKLSAGEHHPKNWEDKRTDEYLLAYAYCVMLNQKSCGILTSDKDLINLMGVCTKILGADEFVPLNERFRNSVVKNGYGIYFKDNSIKDSASWDLSSRLYEKQIDLSQGRFDEKIHTRKWDERQNRGFKEAVWKSLQELKYPKD